MSFNKVNRTSTSVTGPNHGGINGSRFVRDQNKPRVTSVFTGPKPNEYPQGRASQAGGLKSRRTTANQPEHRTPVPSTHLIPSQRDDDSDVPRRTGEQEPNFLDLAFEESSNDSGDDWEEVACTASNTAADLPLIAAPSGFTLPTRGKRSEILTLEVIEDWQPSSLSSASHNDDPWATLPEDADRRVGQELASEQDDSFEADLRLEAELAEGLADLNTPVPGPSRRPQSHTPDVADSITNAPLSTRPPAHLKLEVVEHPSPACASMKGKGKMVDPPTRKPTVSFREKATELARSTGRLFAPSKPLPPYNPMANPSLPTTRGSSSALSKTPHPRIQAAPGSSRTTPQLFTSKGFSHHVQNFRERQTKDNLRQFRERYGGIIVEHPRRDLTALMSTGISVGSLDTPRNTKPDRRCQAQRTSGGTRITKAQAQAEEVMKICRSTKSYIVDMAAAKRREASTIPEPQRPTSSSSSSSIRSEKKAPVILNQRVSKTQAPVPLLVPQLSRNSLGSVPRGLKFRKERKPVPESGKVATETVGRLALSDRDTHGPMSVSASRDNGPLTVDGSKRRRAKSERELEGSSPRKRPRLGGH